MYAFNAIVGWSNWHLFVVDFCVLPRYLLVVSHLRFAELLAELGSPFSIACESVVFTFSVSISGGSCHI